MKVSLMTSPCPPCSNPSRCSVVQVDAVRMAEGLRRWCGNWTNHWPPCGQCSYISRLAREQGIKVLVLRRRGDDLFTGYRRHLLSTPSASGPGYLAKSHPFQLTGHLPANPFRRLRKVFSGAHLDGDARLVHYFRWIERSDLHAPYTPSFRSALGEVQAEDPMLDFLTGLPKDIRPIERMLALEQRFFLADHNLTYTDKMSMAAGVEVRVPFLDLDLVEFGLHSVAASSGREGKWVLKQAMESYLPRDVIYRPKSGFGALSSLASALCAIG